VLKKVTCLRPGGPCPSHLIELDGEEAWGNAVRRGAWPCQAWYPPTLYSRRWPFVGTRLRGNCLALKKSGLLRCGRASPVAGSTLSTDLEPQRAAGRIRPAFPPPGSPSRVKRPQTLLAPMCRSLEGSEAWTDQLVGHRSAFGAPRARQGSPPQPAVTHAGFQPPHARRPPSLPLGVRWEPLLERNHMSSRSRGTIQRTLAVPRWPGPPREGLRLPRRSLRSSSGSQSTASRNASAGLLVGPLAFGSSLSA